MQLDNPLTKATKTQALKLLRYLRTLTRPIDQALEAADYPLHVKHVAEEYMRYYARPLTTAPRPKTINQAIEALEESKPCK